MADQNTEKKQGLNFSRIPEEVDWKTSFCDKYEHSNVECRRENHAKKGEAKKNEKQEILNDRQRVHEGKQADRKSKCYMKDFNRRIIFC